LFLFLRVLPPLVRHSRLTASIHSGRRHHQMHMGMIIQSAGMGMQDRNGPWYALKLFVVLSERPHGLPDALDHQRIELALMAPGQRPEFGRQREGQ